MYSNSNPLDCTYQFVDCGYYFGLQGNRRNSDGDLIRIVLGTNNLQIFQNQTYNLNTNVSGKANGVIFLRLQ